MWSQQFSRRAVVMCVSCHRHRPRPTFHIVSLIFVMCVNSSQPYAEKQSTIKWENSENYD